MKKHKLLDRVLPFSLSALVAGQSCTGIRDDPSEFLDDIRDIAEIVIGGPTLEDLQDIYAFDVSLPPLGDSPYAVKLYEARNNTNNANLLLNAPDGKYTTFSCSASSPLEFTVGFEQEFSKVWIYWRSETGGWNIVGGAANPISLAGMSDTARFAIDPDRSERGYIQRAFPLSSQAAGGEIQIDTGAGSSRYFKFRVWPDESKGQAEFFIDGLVSRE